MPLFGIVFALATGSSAVAQVPTPKLVQVLASYTAPATFETCKRINPSHTSTYDASLKAWQRRTRQAIDQITSVLAKQHEANGVSTLEQAKIDAAVDVADFNRMAPSEQIIGCRSMLEYLTSN
ncbi:hypothetical protein [Rhodanobacter sp. C05]|uniref:hypothetical protein n=1 Tax=Rhodanobacter sp. C05 TaxID=1945855 RepID=UPI00117A5C79|nr:hypothetical protein [Rhodanobacter sp. C05]